jgi:vacuolar-type H+-ATPase subunit H
MIALIKPFTKKWAIITDFREKANNKIGEMVDRNVNLEEEIVDLLNENNDDEINPKKRKENNKKIKILEKQKSDNDTVMAENEIFLDNTEEMFNHSTERLMEHNWNRREELNLVPPPPPMLGYNYDVPNGLFGVKRDTFFEISCR